MLRRAIILFVGGLVIAGIPPRATGQSSLESELMRFINGGRDSSLVAHSGLRIVARGHSQEMAEHGGLNHSGAAERIQQAPPDPPEPNGNEPPDDGFTGTWCENVAYVRGAPQNEVARRIYEGWLNSSSHNRCMNDERMNAAGVGLYFDGDRTYWATYESAVDRTEPGSRTAQAESPTATPTPTPDETTSVLGSPSPDATEPPEPTAPAEPAEPPERTEPPAGVASPAAFEVSPPVPATGGVTLVQGTDGRGQLGVSSSRALAGPVSPSAVQTSFGWAELGATLGLLMLIGELLRRLSRRRDGNETT